MHRTLRCKLTVYSAQYITIQVVMSAEICLSSVVCLIRTEMALVEGDNGVYHWFEAQT